jgi:hypothetical protein
VVDALLRLGILAEEVSELVGGLVDALADRHVAFEPSGSVLVDVAALTEQSRYLFRELMIEIWRRQGWPLQAMGFAEWNLLAEIALAPPEVSPARPTKRMFPGSVIAELQPDGLLLTRATHQPP